MENKLIKYIIIIEGFFYFCVWYFPMIHSENYTKNEGIVLLFVYFFSSTILIIMSRKDNIWEIKP